MERWEESTKPKNKTRWGLYYDFDGRGGGFDEGEEDEEERGGGGGGGGSTTHSE